MVDTQHAAGSDVYRAILQFTRQEVDGLFHDNPVLNAKRYLGLLTFAREYGYMYSTKAGLIARYTMVVIDGTDQSTALGAEDTRNYIELLQDCVRDGTLSVDHRAVLVSQVFNSAKEYVGAWFLIEHKETYTPLWLTVTKDWEISVMPDIRLVVSWAHGTASGEFTANAYTVSKSAEWRHVLSYHRVMPRES